MSGDQLEEYRRRMQQRHTGSDINRDEEIARALQEEENERVRKQALADEEVARKLQSQYQGPEQSNVSSNPPVYGYQAYPAYQVPPSNQPPVYQVPPPQPRQNPYYAPPPGYGRENQPLLPQNSESRTCLPNVNDKCLGVNTQVCVLTTAGLMTIGIIVALVIIAST
mmetsp:Transcript_19515/g.19555  ORF Transcript_19515/g.19555 Transcript_19515/m.19555 type:complete len:167 (+) Transcript_19515:20-520(+)